MRLTEIRVNPRPVAIVRIALAIAAILNAAEVSVILRRIADGQLRFPVFAWLPAPTDISVTLYLCAAVLAGVALASGFHAGVAALVTTALNAWVLLWDQQTYSNHRFLVTLLVAYLVFARSDSTLSVSRGHRPSAVPWWPQLLMMTQLSVCYLFAGLSKINTEFLSGEPLGGWLRWPLPEWLLVVMAFGTVLTELFLAFGLWFRSTCRLAIAAGIALHLSIVVGMAQDNVALFAFAVACVPLYLLFVTRPSLRAVAADTEPAAVPVEDDERVSDPR